jgi:hypothetical protein
VGLVGGEERPAGGSTGGQRRWLPRLPIPARWSHDSGYWGVASCGGTRGGRRGGGLVTGGGAGQSMARACLWRRAARQWRRRRTGAHGKTDRGLILERAGKGRGQFSR